MIISLNGWPGVGKLTIGLELADLLGARLLDNHTMFNVAITLTDYPAPAYYKAVRAVRDIAFDCVLALPSGTPVILTSVNATGGTSGFAEEHWQSICKLAHDRGVPLVSITLECAPDERVRRVAAPGRRVSRKLRDPAVIDQLTVGRNLFDQGADYRHSLDTTHVDAKTCADHISTWIAANVPAA
jgi:shikimate kinase